MKHYDFQPDYTNLVDAAYNRPAKRLPMYEHIVGAKMMRELTDGDPYAMMAEKDIATRREGFRRYWNFWKQLGYDTASYECCVTQMLPGGGALGNHVYGAIHTREDFERYPWDSLCDLFFDTFGENYKLLNETRPEGMKAVGGVGNGLFECVQDLTGYMDLCLMREDDPELYADMFKKLGDIMVRLWTRFLKEYSDAYCVLRFGDDLGFKSSTLISYEDIKAHVIPQYRRITDLVHATNRPFLLHSCGNLFGVFQDIIDGANIDAKHSNEDQIGHFTVWVDKYGDQIGNFGGIDTDVLCRQNYSYIRDYVLDCLEKVSGHGGIAFASGNSIPDYVPKEGYLAMVETVREWRQNQK